MLPFLALILPFLPVYVLAMLDARSCYRDDAKGEENAPQL